VGDELEGLVDLPGAGRRYLAVKSVNDLAEESTNCSNEIIVVIPGDVFARPRPFVS
jgi:hypothetical protein